MKIMSAKKEKPSIIRTSTIHKTDMVINKGKLTELLDTKNLEFIDLHNKISTKFGLDLGYKGFMSLISGRATWKLLYAYAIADILDVDILDIFELITVDVEQRKKEKDEWKQKYQHNPK